MATKRKAMSALSAVGARWEEWGSQWGGMSGAAYAPAGKVFKANNGHTLAVNADTRAEGWDDVLEDLAYGIEDCHGCQDCRSSAE